MRNATSAFKRALVADKRDYTLRAVITLTDNTVLTLGNEDIWEDGMKIEDAVSSDNLFEVGGAIVNQGTLVINNIYDDYSAYDFTNAHVVMYVGLTDLDDGTSDELRMGTFTVGEATYDGSIITLRCLDNMSKFDRAYTFEKSTDNEIIYPATLYNIVSNACHNCGVTLATNSLNFPHKDYVVTNMPSGESTTYRQVISWAAQIAVCFARCNANGELELRWYNTAAIEQVSSLDGGSFDSGTPTYETGDDADGGSFSPWNTGDVYDAGSFAGYPGVDYITSSYSSNVSTDNVVITGITVRKKVQTESSSSAYIEYTSGSAGYTVIVDGNDFIDGTHGQDVANWMGTALIGVSFRKADITHPNDPTIEAGDVGLFIDFRGNMYPIVISSTSFSCNSSQRTVSSAETPAKNSQQRFTESTRNYVELRKQQVRDFNALAQRIAESGGLYETDVTVSGATQRWYHDKPDLEDSNIVMVFTTAGFTLCDDYKDKTEQGLAPTWYGLTVDGQLIASILNADGVNADWINTGAFTVRDANGNITFQADADTGSVIIKAANVPRQFFGNGVPTSTNYPENQWTTDDLKTYHVGDLYTDVESKKVYRYTHGFYGSKIKFSSDSETYNVSSAYVQIFFTHPVNGQSWAYSRVGGSGSTGTLANAEFFIPASEYKIYWYTSDSSSRYFYGWRVESVVTATSETLNNASQFSLPSGTDITASTITPESEHNPYSKNLREIWTVQTGSPGGYGYYWEKVVDGEYEVDPQDVLDEMTQQQIFNKLTNNGTVQGLFLENGRLYMSFEFAQGGTLILGGQNNTNGILSIKDNSNTEIGHWDKDGFSGTGTWEYFGAFPNQNEYFKTQLNHGTLWFFHKPVNSSQYNECGYIQGRYDTSKTLFIGAAARLDIETNYDSSSGGGAITVGYGAVGLFGQEINLAGNTYVGSSGEHKNFTVYGTKNRAVITDNYGDRLLYCYETPTPYFGDIGTGRTDENGEAVISIDDIFDETINTSVEYSVFLQKEGPGDLWINEKSRSYFVVKGTPNLKFSWELKAVQVKYENCRLDDELLRRQSYIDDEDVGLSMETDLTELDNEDLFDETI